MATAEAETPRRNLSRCVTYLKPEVRHAVDLVGEGKDHEARTETLRELILIGLETLGYDQSRIRRTYLRHALECEERGEVNEYTLSR